MAADRVRLREVDAEAPWRWLTGGWSDFQEIIPQAGLYGFVFVAGAAIVSGLLAMAGLSSWIPAAAGGFALLGPFLALGLYEAGRRLEAGETVTLRAMIGARPRAPSQIALLAALLLVIFMLWSRVAVGLFAAFIAGDYMPLGEFASFVFTHPEGLALLAVGTLAGAALAFGVFTITALSMPMLLDRNIDVFTAIGVSVTAVVRQPAVMALWAWIIAVAVAVSVATAFIGLIVAFPVIGLATWRAYRDMVETDDSPVVEVPPALKVDDRPHL